MLAGLGQRMEGVPGGMIVHGIITQKKRQKDEGDLGTNLKVDPETEMDQKIQEVKRKEFQLDSNLSVILKSCFLTNQPQD